MEAETYEITYSRYGFNEGVRLHDCTREELRMYIQRLQANHAYNISYNVIGSKKQIKVI